MNEEFVISTTLYKGYEVTGIYMPTNSKIYRIHIREIREWVESHPKYMYSKYEPDAQFPLWKSFILSPALESWFLLKWS